MEKKDLDIKMATPYEFLKNVDIHLIRHGESESNRLRNGLIEEGKLITDDLKIEDSKIELTEKGQLQAKELGEKLSKYLEENNIEKKQVLVLTSPFVRAKKTFEYSNEALKLDQNSNNYFELNGLREQSYGAFHMISKEVKKELYNQIYTECQRTTVDFYKPQFLGEAPCDVSDRLMNVLYFIKEQIISKDIKCIFIYSHRNVNKCMLMNIFNLPAENYDKFSNLTNASVLKIHNGKLVV